MISDREMISWRALLLTLVVILAGCGEQRFEAKEAPNFTLPTLAAGESITLQDYRDRKSVV
jgi:hypothetical protein